MAMTATSIEVRRQLVNALELDLVGPGPGDELESELLRQHPSRWYLTGFLVPFGASDAQRIDETVTEEVDAAGETGGVDDEVPPETPAARRAALPSSIGISVMLPPGVDRIDVTLRWGDYLPEAPSRGGEEASAETASDVDEPVDSDSKSGFSFWRRAQRQARLTVEVPERSMEKPVPDAGGLAVAVSARPVGPRATCDGGVPVGTRSVSVFLVNRRPQAPDDTRDTAFAFQAQIEVSCRAPLIPRPDLRGLESSEWDERVADLQYRDVGEFAVGHGVSTEAEIAGDATCRNVRTVWIPHAEVERVAPESIPGVELGMAALAAMPDGATVQGALDPLVTSYREWIETQRLGLGQTLTARRHETALELLRRASVAADRIEAGIALLQETDILDAFRIANRAMAAAGRRRQAIIRGIAPDVVEPPEWRPFQLAFLLMNLRGIAEPAHADREVVDLLFFPTGGGKTEAYLGLAAFTLVLRRLRNPGVGSGGVSVLMRYTLRLLTLDQLSRAAALVCALELERDANQERLGEWPFEIGLWVGMAATPNRMGRKGDNDSASARAKTIAFKNDDRKAAPIPLEECPWCGTKFGKYSFDLQSNPDAPENLWVRCMNRECEFTRGRRLPILGVDEPIYRRLPCFLIATVDKFAAMPWIGDVAGFFGKVERADGQGFYGPSEPNRGQNLEGPLPPPDLVIQDELHLIAGPMGTMVGLYETALEALSSRPLNGSIIRPKIVASTATVRRADRQIHGLFGRSAVDVFPPPGPDRLHSFFARTHSAEESAARLYLGVAAQGRSPKVVLLRTYLALLSAAQKAYVSLGAWRVTENACDPYMTLVGYFNSLRELGGMRRIVEDEVVTRLGAYGGRRRVRESDGLFADRKLSSDVLELTSRVPTDKVAVAKRRLSLSFQEKDRVDVALATNMISVGLDITRLGLMVVFGQPKTTAEYIQATSRVGRDHERPGLVVTVLNPHRPRDRSHYERFPTYHSSFYRSVEATGVTPFSPRALDRGLAGTAVALARLGNRALTPPLGAAAISTERSNPDFVTRALTDRARHHADLSQQEADALAQLVRARTEDLLDAWSQIALDYESQGVRLQYQSEVGAARPLLHDFLDPELSQLPKQHWKFRANRSMRDVEPEVNLWVRALDNTELEEDEDQ
jgi:Helicase conserved C-terminal domain